LNLLQGNEITECAIIIVALVKYVTIFYSKNIRVSNYFFMVIYMVSKLEVYIAEYLLLQGTRSRDRKKAFMY
jgi:hypothetical protein